MDYYYKLGYDAFGPIVMNFCKWIEKNCINRGIKKIYFFSRDGFVFKKAFDIMFKDNFKTYYFYASRRAIVVPALINVNSIDDIFKYNIFGNKICLKDFMKKIGLDILQYENVIKRDGIDANKEKTTEEFLNDVKINKFVSSILDDIRSNSEIELEAFIKYASENELTGKVAVVDVGWYGSMQKSLKEIFPNLNLYGLYIGLYPYSKGLDNAFGFLFDSNHDKEFYEKFRNCQNIFEFMTLAQHGSAKKYINSKEYVELLPYEYENSYEEDVVKQIHDGALNYVIEKYRFEEYYVGNTRSADKLVKICCNPKLIDAKKIGKLRLMDKEIVSFAKPEINILAGFKKSLWKIGYLKRVLKIPLPYYKFVSVMRKKGGK